jgi:NAD(P)-dependent dehydrogenase (short-subunit alcohol dehydrogenase family)
MSSSRLSDRVALVVGGGSEPSEDGAIEVGNGRAICQRLAAEGAQVAVADVVAERAQVTVDLIGGGVALEADVADPAQCQRLVDDVVARFGRVDVVVCNVGVHGQQAIREQSVADWDRTLEINTRSHFLVAQAALAPMVRAGQGVFVFVSSTSAIRSSGTSLAYEVSKVAQFGVMRHIAVRYGDRGIRANALVLGVIDTPMARRLFGAGDDDTDHRDAMNPMRRQGRPDEVAAAAAFLASDDSSFVTGTELIVDGGMSAVSYSYRPARWETPSRKDKERSAT